MNYFLLFLALRLASSDKLDRTYLPPPGSKYAGGSEGAIDVPLEYPKESYTTTGRPLQGQNEFQPDDTIATIGINRGVGIGPESQDFTSATQASSTPFNYLQNKYKVPTTTTSYAFSQTTTYPPTDGYETTLTPTGFQEYDGQRFFGSDAGNYPQNIAGHQSLPGQIIDRPGSLIHRPGSLPSIQGQQKVPGRPGSQSQFIPPGYLPTSQQSVFSEDGNIQQPEVTQGQIVGSPESLLQSGFQNIPGSQLTFSSRPQQGQQQFLERPSGHSPLRGGMTSGSQISDFSLRPSAPTGLTYLQGYLPQYQNMTVSQQLLYGSDLPKFTSGNMFRPGLQSDKRTGVQPPFTQQSLMSTTASPQEFFQQPSNTQGIPTIPPNQQQFDEQRRPTLTTTATSSQYTPGTQNIQPGSESTQNQRPSQITGSQLLSTTPSPDNFYSIQNPQYGTDNIGDSIPQQLQYETPMYNQGILPTDGSYSQYKPSVGSPVSDINQQFSQNQYQRPQQFGVTSRPGVYGNVQDIYSRQPMPSITTEYPGQPFPNTSPISGLYESTQSSTFSPTTPASFQEASAQASVGPLPTIPKTERLQAESDRNAVILNYENVLTPEGYSYSFDTSNGIHADESGTAVSGVRAQGAYSYIGDDGKEYSVIYTADENGFLPKGDHLPTPPPIPEAIQRVIEQAQKDKEAGIYHDGSYDESKYGHKKYNHPKPNHMKPNTVNGVDIIKDNFENDNIRPGQQSSSRPYFDQDNYYSQAEQDVDHKKNSYGNKGQNSKQFQKPSGDSLTADNFKESNVIFGKYGNVIPSNEILKSTLPNDSKYKSSTQGLPTKKIQISQHKPTDSSLNEYDESDDYAFIEPDSDNDPLKPGLPRPGTILSQNLPKLQNQKNQKGQKLKPRPGQTTIRYSDLSNGEVTSSYVDDQNMGGPGMKKISGISNQISKHPGISTDSFNGIYDTQIPERFSINTGKQKGVLHPSSTASAHSEGYGTKIPEGLLPQGEKYTYDESKEEIIKGSLRPFFPIMSSNKLFPPEKAEKLNSGYQYIPPKNKLILDEENRFPTRFYGSQVTTTQPTFNKTFDITSTAKPFMTPNVFRNDEESYDDYDTNIAPKKSGKVVFNSTKPPVTEDAYSEYPKTETDYDYNQNKTYQIMPSTEKSSKTGDIKSGSSERPIYPTQSMTRRPSFEYNFTLPNDFIKIRPNQSTPNQDIKGQSPEEYFTQTFGQKVPSTRKPGSKYSFTTTSPVTSTLMPMRFVTKLDGTYQTTPAQSTYESENFSKTVTPGAYEEETVTIKQRPGFRITTQRPTIRPGGISVTTRPRTMAFQTGKSVTDYTNDDSTDLEPEMIRSGFSKAPFTMSTTGLTDDLATTLKPDSLTSSSSYYDRKNPSSTTTRPSSRLPGRPGTRFQNVPSTTYRPNYTLYNNQKPSQVIVDEFGRIIPSDSNERISTPSSRPSYSIPTSTSSPAYNQARIRPGQVSSTNEPFNPNEQRFGQNDEQTQNFFEKGLDEYTPENQRPFGTQTQELFSPNIQGTLGAQNQDQIGPQTTNGQYGVSQSTTEKIIGEDFSGPKQPQRFDPKYGYYY